jgi:hypothetical protein
VLPIVRWRERQHEPEPHSFAAQRVYATEDGFTVVTGNSAPLQLQFEALNASMETFTRVNGNLYNNQPLQRAVRASMEPFTRVNGNHAS